MLVRMPITVAEIHSSDLYYIPRWIELVVQVLDRRVAENVSGKLYDREEVSRQRLGAWTFG